MHDWIKWTQMITFQDCNFNNLNSVSGIKLLLKKIFFSCELEEEDSIVLSLECGPILAINKTKKFQPS